MARKVNMEFVHYMAELSYNLWRNPDRRETQHYLLPGTQLSG